MCLMYLESTSATSVSDGELSDDEQSDAGGLGTVASNEEVGWSDEWTARPGSLLRISAPIMVAKACEFSSSR